MKNASLRRITLCLISKFQEIIVNHVEDNITFIIDGRYVLVLLLTFLFLFSTTCISSKLILDEQDRGDSDLALNLRDLKEFLQPSSLATTSFKSSFLHFLPFP